jgi:hypothetical protein
MFVSIPCRAPAPQAGKQNQSNCYKHCKITYVITVFSPRRLPASPARSHVCLILCPHVRRTLLDGPAPDAGKQQCHDFYSCRDQHVQQPAAQNMSRVTCINTVISRRMPPASRGRSCLPHPLSPCHVKHLPHMLANSSKATVTSIQSNICYRTYHNSHLTKKAACQPGPLMSASSSGSMPCKGPA